MLRFNYAILIYKGQHSTSQQHHKILRINSDLLVLCVMFSRSLFVLLLFVFRSLCCLSVCLLVIVLSILLSFGHCVVYPSVFWSLCCLILLSFAISCVLGCEAVNNNIVDFGLTRHWLTPRSTALEASTLTITPLMWLYVLYIMK